jgi:hypothetical protein
MNGYLRVTVCNILPSIAPPNSQSESSSAATTALQPLLPSLPLSLQHRHSYCLGRGHLVGEARNDSLRISPALPLHRRHFPPPRPPQIVTLNRRLQPLPPSLQVQLMVLPLSAFDTLRMAHPTMLPCSTFTTKAACPSPRCTFSPAGRCVSPPPPPPPHPLGPVAG